MLNHNHKKNNYCYISRHKLRTWKETTKHSLDTNRYSAEEMMDLLNDFDISLRDPSEYDVTQFSIIRLNKNLKIEKNIIPIRNSSGGYNKEDNINNILNNFN